MRFAWLEMLVGIAGLAIGLIWCLAMAVVEWVAWYLVLPSRRAGSLARSIAAEGDRDLSVSIEAITSDGVRLAGLWHDAGVEPPTGKGRGRTVLVLHGFAEDPSVLRGRMEALGQHGWNVAALDTRAHGRSGGDRISFGDREAADVRSWIDALDQLGKLGPEPTVAIWGRSMGAAIAIRTAASDSRVGALVLESAYADLKESLISILIRKRIPFARPTVRLILKRAERLAGNAIDDPSPINVAPRVPVPVLLVNGANDRITPPDLARRLAAAFPSRAAVIEVVGAGHNNVIELGGAALLEQIGNFLDESVRQKL